MKKLPLILLSIIWAGSIFAEEPNQIPSCYQTNKMEISAPASERQVLILLDETTRLDDRLKVALGNITQSLIKPGVRFSVIGFSAFSQGRYLNRLSSGVLESPINPEERSSISVRKLKRFDACMAEQARYGLALAYKAEKSVLESASSDLQKSDVIASLSEVSRLIKDSQSPKKTILIISDMLENSSITSFYAKNAVRKIDSAREIKIVTREKMLADFAGADVYVMGAGLVNESGKSVYRDPKTMSALKEFWSEYVRSSNGTLVEFGMPFLLTPP